jgi:putative nucleotidyltransferase with HDIG domain
MAVMRRRFVEALRRAEMVSLLSEAQSESELGRALAEELCEVYDAEAAFVLAVTADGARRLIAELGGEPSGPSTASPLLDPALAGERAVDGPAGSGPAVVAASAPDRDGVRVAIGVIREYEQAFDPAERALLESITSSAARALERIWGYEERERLVDELRESSMATAAALANAMEARDDYTANHAQEIGRLALLVGQWLGLSEAELETVRWGGIFHDIGKIAVPDEILRKPGPLSGSELELIKRHVTAGELILAPLPFLADVRPIVRHSHERFDGDGYPDGLSGDQIPLGARIVAVVDAWHAMVSDRPYHSAVPAADARKELELNSGSQFDPEVVTAFLEALDAGAS